MSQVIAAVILVAVAVVIATLLSWHDMELSDLERNASIQDKERSAYTAGTLGITCAGTYKDNYYYRFCLEGKIDKLLAAGETKE